MYFTSPLEVRSRTIGLVNPVQGLESRVEASGYIKNLNEGRAGGKRETYREPAAAA